MIVNVEARDLGLGSGGFDVVHVNLTRGLDGPGAGEAAAMKLNYTSLQHPVDPVEALRGGGRRATDSRPGALAPRTARTGGLGGGDACRAGCESATSRRRAAPCRGRCRRTSPSSAAAGCSAITSPPAPAYGGEREAITRDRRARGCRGTARLGRRDRRTRAGDRRLRQRAGARRDGRARHGARRARPRTRDPDRAADVERRPAGAPPRPEPSHRDRSADAARGRARAGAGRR